MNLLRAIQVVFLAVIYLLPVSTFADIVIRSFEAELSTSVTVNFADGTIRSESAALSTQTADENAGISSSIGHLIDGDPWHAFATSRLSVDSALNSWELYLDNDPGLFDTGGLAEGTSVSRSTANATMVFSVVGLDEDFGALALDSGTGDTSLIWLRDLTTGDSIFSIGGFNPGFQRIDVSLSSGHTYKVRVHSLNRTQDDEEISSIWRFHRGANVDVPEPGTMALFGIGLAGMGLARRRRNA